MRAAGPVETRRPFAAAGVGGGREGLFCGLGLETSLVWGMGQEAKREHAGKPRSARANVARGIAYSRSRLTGKRRGSRERDARRWKFFSALSAASCKTEIEKVLPHC